MFAMKILTIDLEDWFHIVAHEPTSGPVQWEKFESRIERNTSWLLEQLLFFNQPATFFCLGWIARKYPHLIKRISEAGYEIACHSMNHQLVFNQSPDEFRKDLLESMDILQQQTGKMILSYRAPGFSVSEKTNWVFEILAEAGIVNDCSVFPAERNHGGYKKFSSLKPCLLSVNGMHLREFPMSLATIAGRKVIYSGGGYFRLLPYMFIRKFVATSDYVMTYFHPRDFDADQPLIDSLPLKRKFMSYVGLKSSKAKFLKLLDEFKFMSVEEAALNIDWNKAETVELL
jgi:polysaccharide deacetylase family protein (PEP-CTERM system associated)